MALVALHLRWRPVGEAFKRDGKPRRVRNGLKNPPRAGGAAALPFPFVPSLLGGFLCVHAAVSWGECSHAGPIPVYFKTRKEPQSRHAAVVCPPLAKSGRGPARPKTQTETARVGGPSWGWGALPAARGSPGAFLSAPLQAPRRPSRPGLPSSFPPRPAAPALVCSSSLPGLRNYSCLLIHLPWHPSLRAVSPHAAAGKAPKGQVGLSSPG